MKLDIFGKDDCAICASTRRKLEHFLRKWGFEEKVDMSFVNMDTVEGMAEGAFRDVTEIPTTIISADGETCARWEGAVPPSEEVRGVISSCFSRLSG